VSELVVVWRYDVRPDAIAPFERDYGPHGAWAALFRRDIAYRGTDLCRVQGSASTYMTFDRWQSAASRAAFLAAHRVEYDALDARCGVYTIAEVLVGEFARQDSAATATPCG
jgi:hypothetical protein